MTTNDISYQHSCVLAVNDLGCDWRAGLFSLEAVAVTEVNWSVNLPFLWLDDVSGVTL